MRVRVTTLHLNLSSFHKNEQIQESGRYEIKDKEMARTVARNQHMKWVPEAQSAINKQSSLSGELNSERGSSYH